MHFDYLEFNSNDESIIPYKSHYKLEICTGAEFYFDSHEVWWQKGVEAWRKIYKRSFLLDHNLMFANSVMYEDVDYSINMFSIAQKVKHLDIAPYYYRNNSLSITNSTITPVHLKYWILLVLRCNKLQENFNIKENIDPRFDELIENFIKYQVGCVIDNLRKFNFENRKMYYSLLGDVDLVFIRKYVSIRKYLYLKYPVINV